RPRTRRTRSARSPARASRQRRLCGVERTREVDRDDVFPVAVRVLLDRLAAIDAHTVDEHVDAAELLRGLAHRAARRLGVAQVGLDVVARLCVDDGDVSAVLAEGTGDRRAEAARAAGD